MLPMPLTVSVPARRIGMALLLLALVLLAVPVRAQTSALPTAPILRIETGMHMAPIRSISVDAANRYVATASYDKTARVWDAKTGALLSILRPPIGDGNQGKLYAVAISPDGNTVACGGSTSPNDQLQDIYLFDRATGTLRKRLTGLPNNASYLAYSPDGRYLAATLSSGGLRLYETSDDALTANDADYSDQCYGASFGFVAGSLRLVTSCYDSFVRLYDVDAVRGALHLRAKSRAPGGSRPVSVAFSPDGNKIAVGFADTSSVNVVSADDLSDLYSPDTTGVYNGISSNVCWSADGRFPYAGGAWFYIRRWTKSGKGAYRDIAAAINTIFDLQPRKAGGVFFGAADPAWGTVNAEDQPATLGRPAIADFRANRDGLRLASDGSAVIFGYQLLGKSPAVFSLTNRTLTLAGDASSLNAPVTTADELDVQDWQDSIAPTLNGQALKLHNYETSRGLAIAPDHKSFLLGTIFYLRLFGKDGTQKWQTDIPGFAWAVNISSNGKLAVAAFGDGTIRWYRMTDGQELLAFFPHADRKRWVLWTPSGYYDCSPGAEDLNDPNGKYFFLPGNFDRDKVKRTGLPWTDLVSTVQDIAGKVILFNDSCHSGNVLGGGLKGLSDSTGAINELISAENGAVVFAASTGSEFAREDVAWGNGAFTKAVVEGISGAADYGHTGRITVNMLSLYVAERVKTLTGGAQHPTTEKPPTVRDFPLALDGP